jgi:hypothetical protein
MVESPPASPLEVSQAEFALQFLVVAFSQGGGPEFGAPILSHSLQDCEGRAKLNRRADDRFGRKPRI